MQDILRACIQNFGEPPRSLSFMDRMTYLSVRKPIWLRLSPGDAIARHFKNLNTVYTEGVVVWGHVVQANTLLFEESIFNCPGEIVYSLEDAGRANPDYLQSVAEALFRLKGTKPNSPDLRQIADYLAAHTTRVFGLPVPASISPSIRCRFSTTFFVRKHLPNRRLCGSFLPIVVSPRKPHTVVPLPERYWPPEFVAWWCGQ